MNMKEIEWEEDKGEVWLGYNDLVFLAKRHGVTQCSVVENCAKR